MCDSEKADDLTKPSYSIFNKQFRLQLLATLTAHVLTFSHGVGMGWLSPALQILQSPQTPLVAPLSIAQASWLGALFGAGSLIGNIIFGFFLERAGRKWCMYSLAIPHMLLWILIYFATSVEYLYAARFFGGFTGGGNYVVMPIFISEIATASIRGALTSMTMFFRCFGILMGFILTSQLSYYMMPCIVIVLPIVYFIATCMFPETPQYLLKSGKAQAAEKSFKFYKNIKEKEQSPTGCAEFDELKEVILKGNECVEPVTLRDFFTKPALKAFLTAFVIMMVTSFSGDFAFINYSSLIFKLSGSVLETNTCTIIMGVSQIVGTIVTTILVDRLGRKLLYLFSCITMAIFLTVFGVFTQFASVEQLQQYNWLPVVLMALIMFCSSLGVSGLVFVIVVEIFPTKIRSAATSLSVGLMSALISVTLMLYPFTLDTYGLPATMYLCATACFIGVIYLGIFLQETKGKSMDFD